MGKRQVTVAAVQMQCTNHPQENLKKAEKMVRQAAAAGAQIILLSELFEREYFCQQRRYDFYSYAKPVEENEAVCWGQKLAKELKVVLPISFYEKEVNNLYNSVASIDADGEILGVYRKTHIPDDHYYQEKFYFTPGDTGFRVFDTRYRCGNLLGSVVPGNGTVYGFRRSRTALLSYGDRFRTNSCM